MAPFTSTWLPPPLPQRIAEGNPDPDRIGAFGVGFYSLFSVCEEPIVLSGDELMGFFWKGDALYTRRAPAPPTEPSASGAPWTTFLMALREPIPFPESPLALTQFLMTSLTFTHHVRAVALYLDDTLLCSLQKSTGSAEPLAPSRHLRGTSPEGMLRAQSLHASPLRLHARVARLVLREAAAAAQASSSLRQTLANAFSKTAGAGASIAGMLAGAFGRSTARPPPPPMLAPVDDTADVDLVSATLPLRLMSAQLHVHVSSSFSREIERSTKKALPRTTLLHMVYMGKDDLDAFEVPADTAPVDAHISAVFEGVMPQLDTQGRIFIGFRTHQTTSFAGHLAARFIPTVERESMDFVDRYCAAWNMELLALGGYVARVVYEHEMQRLGAQWSADPGTQAAVHAGALHTMRFFSFHRSSPSARVSTALEQAFFACCQRPAISLLSTEGLRSSDAVRFPSAMLADFCREIPVLPPAHIEAAEVFVLQLRRRSLVQDITMDDVFAELARRPLTPTEMIACLQWWCRVAEHPSYDPSLRRQLVRAAVVATDDGVQALSDVETVLHTGKLPPSVPLPPTCLVYAVSRPFSPADLGRVFGWRELSVAAWVQYMIELDRSPAPEVRAAHGLTQSAVQAETVLSTLAWTWGHLPKAQATEIVQLLRPLACVPTRSGMRRPGDAYFASVSLFQDLPIVAFPTLTVRGPLERVLEALGVRRHVEIQLLLDRLLEAGDWSHMDLVAYLAKQRSHLTAAEMERLAHTALFPAENDGQRHKAAQLYEPNEALRQLCLPVLAWPGRAWRASGDEAKLLWDLGLKRHPPLPLLLARAAGEKPASTSTSCDAAALRSQALAYLLQHFAVYRNAYTLEAAAPFAFVPARDGALYPPTQVYTDPAAASMQFPVARVAPLDAVQLQLAAHPSGAALVQRLREAPPSADAARDVFTFLSSARTLSATDLEQLSRTPFVPVGARSLPPVACYLGGAHAPRAYQAVFAYVDFGPTANGFLRSCGVRDEPSVADLVQQVVADPIRFYELCQHPDTYLDVLRRMAHDFDDLPSSLRSKMASAPFLLGHQPSSREESETQAYALRCAKDVVVVDDAHAHMLFSQHLFVAPHDETLEALYVRLGAPHLSELVRESFTVAGTRQPDTPRARLVQAAVLERTPLFLFEKRALPSHEIVRDMDWLQRALVVVEVGAPGIQQKRVLSYRGQTHTDVQPCSAMAQMQGQQWVLHVAQDMELDWFEIALALAKALLARQPLQEVLLFMTLLSSPLKSLKRKGFHVDKILAQQRTQQAAAPAPLVESEPAWDSWRSQLLDMFPDAQPAHVDRLLRSFDDAHLQRASEAMLSQGYPKVVKKPQVPVLPPNENKSEKAAQPERSMEVTRPKEPMPAPPTGSFLHQWKARFTGRTPTAPPPTAPPPTQPDDRVAPPAEIQRQVQRAIQASRPDASSVIQSQSQQVHEAATHYCDVAGLDVDLSLAGRVHGTPVFVSRDLSAADLLTVHAGALDRLIRQVYRPIGAIFGIDPRSMNVFCDTKGPSIAFNRGGTLYLNLRYYLAWHDADVQAGRLAGPLVSVYFTMAHELAHNLVAAHNSEHEFYFSSIAEQYVLALAQYIGSLGGGS